MTSATHSNRNDEADVLNSGQTERPSADGEARETVKSLLKAKKNLIFSTYNARTLRKGQNMDELLINFKKQGISVLGIQEHRRVHEDEPISYQECQGQYIITSSAWRNSQNAAVGGVGLLLDRRAQKALGEVKSISNRILMATFQGNPATTVIVAYSPTSTQGNEEEVENFYTNLREATKTTPKHNMLVILGDFNAHLGKSFVEHSYHEESSRNGEYLLDFVEEQQLTICNCNFKKKPGKLWTFIDPSGRLCQKDYILINNKWKNSVKNAEPYSSFASVGSDHRVVSATIKLSLRTPKETKRDTVKYDWKVLRNDKSLQEQYTVEVRNRYEELMEETDDPSTRWGKLVESTKEVAKQILPIAKKNKKRYLPEGPLITKAREDLEQASKNYETKRSKANRLTVKEKKQKLKDAYEELEEKELTGRINEIRQSHANQQHAEAWKLINDITGRKKTPTGKLNAKNQEERKKLWFDHFSKLLGGKPEQTDDTEIENILENLGIDDGPFTLKEYVKAKKATREGSAAGDDGLVPEIFTRCDFDSIMLDFCNRLHIHKEKPEQWEVNNIIPLPKKGDLGTTGNYRGIALSAIITKIINRMILNRIRPAIDPLLRRNQNGFRPGRTTIGQILALRRLIEEIKRRNLPAVFTFIDFSKAFDSINREKMFKILKAYGVPPNLLETIIAIYTNTKAKVLSPDGETDVFEITMGVLQGDTLAPFLFVIALDFAMRKAIEEQFGFTITPKQSRRIQAKTITDLDFADDIALLSDMIEQARKLLLAVERECIAVGLDINAKKTKFISYNTMEEFQLLLADGTCIKRAVTQAGTQDFQYLGSWIDNTWQDIKVRKGQAWAALNKMDTIWKSTLKRETKMDLFKATVESVLLYGCETWTLNKKLNKSLDGCYTRMLRKVQNISWKQHLTNKELYGTQSQISSIIRKRRLRFAGHSVRQHDQNVSDLVLWEPTHGTRNRGGQAKNFVDILKEDTGCKSTQEIRTCMEDRDVWRGIVSRCSAKNVER